MNGERVGVWTIHRGEHQFNYDKDWLLSPRARPLSLSMPLRPSDEPYRTDVVQPFFDNLLPDSDEIRRRMSSRFGTASTSPFDLLEEMGRDCVGAIQLLRPDAAPPDIRDIQGRKIADADIAKLLAQVRAPNLLAQDDDFRISLAGAQEKTALLWHDNAWCVPEGTTPTTHIFKLPIPASEFEVDVFNSVENEWLCAQLLRQYGIPCADSRIMTFAGQQVLVVTRFDRKLSSNGEWFLRLPQEDFCQATKTPPGKKYEKEGGPGILKIMELLQGSNEALRDREDFLKTQFLFWLMCATDGHAKNFSVFIEPEGRFRLTPMYDVISVHPYLGRRQTQVSQHKVTMAMAVIGRNRHYKWKEIHVSHWLETARKCGMAAAPKLFAELIERTPEVIEKVRAALPPNFPDRISGPILEGLADKAEAAKDGLVQPASLPSHQGGIQ
ncbi:MULTISPECIES: type II toxin-antitoxin system HipA family toxin [Corallococcus]|uniref:type II toxin-antitoxin system HipA family toxin n=1 Tax=Corallococcus TaxID=83461 RepID=UPI0018F558A4|nr:MULTISPECIES: type II toxin-antitoxin system HipA family toxin [Corallococcus]